MAQVRKCEICGREFIPNSPNQKMCGSEECHKERQKQYAHDNVEMHREATKRYRENNKEYKKLAAAYDKKYQIEHKEQISEYKKIWFQKQQFFKYLKKGVLLKGTHWFNLTIEEKEKILLENKYLKIGTSDKHGGKIYVSENIMNLSYEIEEIYRDEEKRNNKTKKTKEIPAEILEYFEKGCSNLSSKYFEIAIECFNKCIELDNTYKEAYLKIGETKEELGLYEEAFENYRRAFELAPEQTYYLNKLDLKVSDLTKYEDLIDFYSDIIQKNPDDAKAYYYRARVYYEIYEQYEEAKEDYTLAIEKGFDDAIVYASRGVANMHSENIQEANIDFKKALELGFNETDENAFITVEDINYFLE